MILQIFYCWQSDTDANFGKRLIQEALSNAIRLIESEGRDIFFKPILSRAGEMQQAGSPNIVKTINEKIRSSDIFVADITYVTQYDLDSKVKVRKKGAINSNVAIELGQAKALLEDERIIKVMNSVYGSPNVGIELPFDIEQDRYPIEYKADSKASAKIARANLTNVLKDAIKNIIREHDVLQKEKYKPFITFNRWGEGMDRSIDYILTDNLITKIKIVQAKSYLKGESIRISGISGIGKSRFVYESLMPNTENKLLISSILYYDILSEATSSISDKILDLTAGNESFLFIIDNALSKLHDQLSRIIDRVGSNSVLLTISSELENLSELGGKTVQLRLEHEDGKAIALAILQNRFKSLDNFILRHVISLVGGLPSLAVKLAHQESLNLQEINNITSTTWVDSVLGQKGTNDKDRSILRALAAFGKVGYEDEVADEAKLLADFDSITPMDGLSDAQRRSNFSRTIQYYVGKEILVRKGRYVLVQPQFLAIELAREWWLERVDNEISEILKYLGGLPLIERLFDQLRQIGRLPMARELVHTLCSANGAVGRKDLILTAEGAQILEYLADIDPETVANCLARELLLTSIPVLHQASEGRRSLVRALEKLCRYGKTFNKSAKVLMNLAVAENEYILNNATGQFLQLFQYRLAGTSVDYNSRIQILTHGLAQSDSGFDGIIVEACARALSVDKTDRFIFEGEQLKEWKEFEAKGDEEIFSYWKGIIDILDIYIKEIGHPMQLASAQVLISAFTELSEYSAGSFLPSLKYLSENLQSLKLETHKAVKYALHFRKDLLIPEEIIALTNIFESTEPILFEEKLNSFVYEFTDSVDRVNLTNESVDERIMSLVPEFIRLRSIWEIEIGRAIKGSPFHTFVFFRKLGESLAGDTGSSEIILTYLLESFKTDLVGSYLEPLTGFLNGAGPEITDSAIRKVMNSFDLRHLVFRVVKGTSPKREILFEIMNLVKSGDLGVQGFVELEYSLLLSNLDTENFNLLIGELDTFSVAGKWVALSLIWNKIDRGDKYDWSPYIRRRLLLKNIWNAEIDSSLIYKAINELYLIIEETVSKSVLAICTRQLVNYISTRNFNKWRGNGAYPLFKKLLEKDFDEAWKVVSNSFESKDSDNLYDVLGSSTNSRATDGVQKEDQGLLFQFGNYGQILIWCRKFHGHPEKLLRFVSKMPVRNPDKSDS